MTELYDARTGTTTRLQQQRRDQPAEHRTAPMRARSAITGDRLWRATCRCGWIGDTGHSRRAAAVAEGRAHERLPALPAERPDIIDRLFFRACVRKRNV